MLLVDQQADGPTGMALPGRWGEGAPIPKGAAALVVHAVVADAVLDSCSWSFGASLRCERGSRSADFGRPGRGEVDGSCNTHGKCRAEAGGPPRLAPTVAWPGIALASGEIARACRRFGVVRSGGFEDDSKTFQLGLEQDLATARLAEITHISPHSGVSGRRGDRGGRWAMPVGQLPAARRALGCPDGRRSLGARLGGKR